MPSIRRKACAAEPQPPIPLSEYTKLKYIGCNLDSTIGPYIDTGYIHKSNTGIECQFECNNVSRTYMSVYGSRLSNYKSNAFCLFYRFGLNWEFCYNRSGVETHESISESYVKYTSHAYGNTVEISAPGRSLITITTTGTPDDGANPMFIFNINTASSAGESSPDTSSFSGIIYFFKIYELVNGIKVYKRNMYPVKRNSDGVVGMFDYITNTFYSSANSYSFYGKEEQSKEDEIKYGDGSLNTVFKGYTNIYLNKSIQSGSPYSNENGSNMSDTQICNKIFNFVPYNSYRITRNTGSTYLTNTFAYKASSTSSGQYISNTFDDMTTAGYATKTWAFNWSFGGYGKKVNFVNLGFRIEQEGESGYFGVNLNDGIKYNVFYPMILFVGAGYNGSCATTFISFFNSGYTGDISYGNVYLILMTKPGFRIIQFSYSVYYLPYSFSTANADYFRYGYIDKNHCDITLSDNY